MSVESLNKPIFADDSGLKSLQKRGLAYVEVEIHSRPPNLSLDQSKLRDTIVRRMRHEVSANPIPFQPVDDDQKKVLIAYSAYCRQGIGAQIREQQLRRSHGSGEVAGMYLGLMSLVFLGYGYWMLTKPTPPALVVRPNGVPPIPVFRTPEIRPSPSVVPTSVATPSALSPGEMLAFRFDGLTSQQDARAAAYQQINHNSNNP